MAPALFPAGTGCGVRSLRAWARAGKEVVLVRVVCDGLCGWQVGPRANPEGEAASCSCKRTTIIVDDDRSTLNGTYGLARDAGPAHLTWIRDCWGHARISASTLLYMPDASTSIA